MPCFLNAQAFSNSFIANIYIYIIEFSQEKFYINDYVILFFQKRKEEFRKINHAMEEVEKLALGQLRVIDDEEEYETGEVDLALKGPDLEGESS